MRQLVYVCVGTKNIRLTETRKRINCVWEKFNCRKRSIISQVYRGGNTFGKQVYEKSFGIHVCLLLVSKKGEAMHYSYIIVIHLCCSGVHSHENVNIDASKTLNLYNLFIAGCFAIPSSSFLFFLKVTLYCQT